MGFDADRKIVIGPINRIATVITLIRRDSANPAGKIGQRLEGEIGPMHDTPYLMKREYLFRRDQGLLPMTKPPWGMLVAVDLNSGKLKWEVPLGWMLDPERYPEAKHWGSLNLGGAITTRSGLAFIAATFDNHLRAFGTETGELLWESELPASAQATPMTYAVGSRQFVVVCAGGHGKMGSKLGDYVMAFALP